jgi:hypothetical protein
VERITAPGAGVADAELTELAGAIEAAEPAFLADLERLVNIDCGSYTPEGVDEVGRFVAGCLADLGADVEAPPDRRQARGDDRRDAPRRGRRATDRPDRPHGHGL